MQQDNQFESTQKNQVKVSIRTIVSIPIKIRGQTVKTQFITFYGLASQKEHFVIAFKDWEKNLNPMVRLHSECITGDIFSSLKCDCGPQLQEALIKLHENNGILIYMRDEGRGIGLYNKIDAYELQEQGLDTYAANLSLKLNADERNYKEAAQILIALNKTKICLFTNNPEKILQLKKNNIIISSVIPTQTHINDQNIKYLKTKKDKTNHTLNLKKNGESI